MEKDLFDPGNVKIARSNLSKDEKKALKEIKSWNNRVVRVQDKGSRFFILENETYEEKEQHQIDRNSFKELKDDPSKLFQEKVNNWIEKWYANKVIDNSLKSFVSCDSPSAGKMYGLVKTHKVDNPVRIITSGCNTAVENLSICLEKVLYSEVEEIPSRIKDTNHMLDIIDNLNDSNLPDNSVLVSFDIVNMFPSIDNESGIKAVKEMLNVRENKNPPTECILEALRLCLGCNNSVFNDKNFLQTDGTTQGPHMSCSYSDIAMAHFDIRAENYDLKPTAWKRFGDGVFSVWTHDVNTLPAFLDYLNNIDSTGKIKFTMQIADDNGLEFLDLKLKIQNGKISVDVYSKPTNSFTYVMPSTCYPRKNINNVPRVLL